MINGARWCHIKLHVSSWNNFSPLSCKIENVHDEFSARLMCFHFSSQGIFGSNRYRQKVVQERRKHNKFAYRFSVWGAGEITAHKLQCSFRSDCAKSPAASQMPRWRLAAKTISMIYDCLRSRDLIRQKGFPSRALIQFWTFGSNLSQLNMTQIATQTWTYFSVEFPFNSIRFW